MFQKHEKSADPCPCLFLSPAATLLLPVPSCWSGQQHVFVVYNSNKSIVFFFFSPSFFISEYVTNPLSGNVPSVSVCVWRVYLRSAFHSQKCLF